MGGISDKPDKMRTKFRGHKVSGTGSLTRFRNAGQIPKLTTNPNHADSRVIRWQHLFTGNAVQVRGIRMLSPHSSEPLLVGLPVLRIVA
jgi:hypothetical protein